MKFPSHSVLAVLYAIGRNDIRGELTNPKEISIIIRLSAKKRLLHRASRLTCIFLPRCKAKKKMSNFALLTKWSMLCCFSMFCFALSLEPLDLGDMIDLFLAAFHKSKSS